MKNTQCDECGLPLQQHMETHKPNIVDITPKSLSLYRKKNKNTKNTEREM